MMRPDEDGIAVYRIMDKSGDIINKDEFPNDVSFSYVNSVNSTTNSYFLLLSYICISYLYL